MSAISEQDLAALTALLGPGRLRQGQAALELDHGIHPDNLKAELVVLPQNSDEVSRLLAFCHARRLAVVPQGGRSGLAAAAISKPGEVILALQAMNRIEEIDAEGGTAIVQAGVTLEALEQALAPLGWSAGIDLGARGSCTIGGMVSTNAGGMEAFRFGTMRQRVLGLEVVLPDGRVMRELTRVIKANNGYDIKQLFIGAEGTLGVVTRIALKLVPQRRPSATALIACASAAAAVKLTKQLERLDGASAERIEVMWRNHFDITAADRKLERLATLAPSLLVLVVEIAAGDAASAEAALEAALGQALEEGLAQDAFIAKNEEERRQFWLVREDWAVDRKFPGGLWYDISVPPPKLAAYSERLTQKVKERDPGWQTFFIGHLADGNLHVTVNSPKPLLGHYEEVSKLVYDGLAAVGGSFSAEHGIGLEKKAALAKQGDPVKLSLMRAIKRAFDPLNIMNPGKVIDL